MPCVETFPATAPGISVFALVTESEVFLFDYDAKSVDALIRTVERYAAEGLISSDGVDLILNHIS